MKLKLNKKKIKSLSSDKNALPVNATPQVGGGTGPGFCWNYTCDDFWRCRTGNYTNDRHCRLTDVCD